MKKIIQKRLAMRSGFQASKAVYIENRQHLGQLEPTAIKSIHEEFNAESLSSRLCPVLMADHSVAIFALREYVGSDQADELHRRILAKGYVLCSPARYVLEAPLLLSVARNQFAAGTAVVSDADKQLRHSRTALTDAFQDLVEWGVNHNASDLHINIDNSRPESEVKYTIGGRYVAPERFRHMSTSMLNDMLAVVWMDIKGGNGALFDPRAEQQGSLIRQLGSKNVVIRWASLAADNGPSVCMRLLVRNIDPKNTSLGSLGYLPEQISTIERTMMSAGGAIVFAGTVGSGKSTTLAALVSSLSADRKIITIEDPVEYLIPNAIQNTVTRSLSDVQPQTYAAKLRTIKRSAMTDVLLGEIRDQETGQAFMDLAGSGINIYTTVHAPSAALIPDRLASDFIGVSRDFLVTPGTLRLLVFQTLIGELCQECSLPVSCLYQGYTNLDDKPETGRFWGKWLDKIQSIYAVDVMSMRIRNHQGCAICSTGGISALKGYAGRTVAAEIIEPALQPEFLNSIRIGNLDYWHRVQAEYTDKNSVLDNGNWNSAMDTAIIKAIHGLVDPRDIECSFESFDTRYKRAGLQK